jgi:hypothetical protein
MLQGAWFAGFTRPLSRNAYPLLNPRPTVRGSEFFQSGGRIEFGFFWDTTRSGKTLASFKASMLHKLNDNIHQCVFVVDRKDLDHQTRTSPKARSPQYPRKGVGAAPFTIRRAAGGTRRPGRNQTA